MSDETEKLFDLDLLEQQVENAPTAGLANVNYGKLTTTIHYRSWDDASHAYVRREPKPKEPLKEGEVMELDFMVQISELNPKLDFEYERSVAVQKSGKTVTDWEAIVLPSLVDTFGAAWVKAIVNQHPYVAIEDTPNTGGRTSKKGNIIQMPKFIATYPNKAACVAARDARYTPRSNGAATPAEEGIPQSVLDQAKALAGNVNEATLRQLLDQKPFGNYETDAILEALK